LYSFLISSGVARRFSSRVHTQSISAARDPQIRERSRVLQCFVESAEGTETSPCLNHAAYE
jgi:hypothetical protein